MSNKKINIAIDGFSSCGKGTLAKHLANTLNYLFIDSGAMYRALTLYFIRHKVSAANVQKQHLENISITFKPNSENTFFETYLNNDNVERDIRAPQVNNEVSAYAKQKIIRDFLVKQQQEIAKNKGVVMDGRDIGTVVIPDAELKIFMTAKPEIRAKRRYNEMIKKGYIISYDEVLKNIIKRDNIDTTRSESPLVPAKDAITLDNTEMTPNEQAQVALTWARGVIKLIS